MSNIEDDVEILESIVKVHNDFLQGVNKESINEKEIRALEHLLSHYKNMKFNYENLIHDISLIAESLGMQEDSTIEEIAIRISEEMYNQQQINEEHQKINGELREKVKELEKESKILEFQNKQIENYAEELKKYNKTVSDRIVEYKKNSIPKQVVKDKIEELMIQGNYKTFYNPNGRTHFLKEESDCKIEVLQELLEGEKNNENIKS